MVQALQEVVGLFLLAVALAELWCALGSPAPLDEEPVAGADGGCPCECVLISSGPLATVSVMVLDLESFLAESRTPKASGRLAALSRRFPQSVVQATRNEMTRAVAPLAARKMAEALRQADGRLHLGCGFNRLNGWLNIDRVGAQADIYWDLRRPVPLPDHAARAVFHEHLLEHLPYSAGYQVMKECHRLTAPGGVVRVVVPDAGRRIAEYFARSDHLLEWAPTHLMAAKPLLSDYGHVSMYDSETLTAFFTSAGFEQVRVCGFGESNLDPAPDDPARAGESLYVEGIRP